MKYFIIFIFFVLNSTNIFADSKIVYYDSSTVKFIAVFDEYNFAFERTYELYNAQNKPISSGGDIIFTKDGGFTFDTLRSWWLPLWEYDSNAVNYWQDLRIINYFDSNTLFMMHKDGKYYRYDLTTKQCDSAQLIPKSVIYDNPHDNAKEIEFSLFNPNKAIVSYHYYDSAFVTKDKGLTWIGIDRPKAIAELKPNLSPRRHVLINENLDFYFFYSNYLIEYLSGPGISIAGYSDDKYFSYSYIYHYTTKKLTPIYIGPEANFDFPTFINDSVAFAPGHKAYFMSDSLHADSAFSKPVVYKTTDRGTTWQKVYESKYFIGNKWENISIFGDTLILPYGTLRKAGYIMSTDFGETWKEYDMSHLLEEKDRLKDIKVVSPNTFLIGIDVNFTEYCYILKYTPGVVSVPEEKFFAFDAKLYPNPAFDFVNIEFDGNLGVPDVVEVYDVLGNRISSPIYRSAGSVMINTSQINVGAYTVKISTSSGTISKTFMKVR